MKCARCRNELKAGVTFCIGCGFDNGQSSIAGQRLKIESQLEKKAQRRGFWRRVTSLFFIIGRR